LGTAVRIKIAAVEVKMVEAEGVVIKVGCTEAKASPAIYLGPVVQMKLPIFAVKVAMVEAHLD